MLRLWRSSRPLLRGFSSTPAATAAHVKQLKSTYYERLARKIANWPVTHEMLDRTTHFLLDRGMTHTQALRAISHHVMLVKYSKDLMESKIRWLSDLGLTQDKINDTILRHPNFLGITIKKYEALVDWYISHGVPRTKIPYLFNVFPQATSYSLQHNLDVKVKFLREIGLDDMQVTRFLSMAPQIFTLSVKRLHVNVNYMVELGIPRKNIAGIVSVVPQCLALTPSRMKETVDTLDDMFGVGAGVQALTFNGIIVMYNISGMRKSFKYLVSVGFSEARLEKNTRFITRNVDRFLRPRVKFLQRKNHDFINDTTWILMPEGRFTEKYPDYAAYLTKYKAWLKKGKADVV